MLTFPFETVALSVEQRIGTFYVAVLPAELLLRVSTSDTMRATLNDDGTGYTLDGTQRVKQEKRMMEISEYIKRIDAVFPNSIIVAANYDSQVGFDQEEVEEMQRSEPRDANSPAVELEDGSKAWTVSEERDGIYRLRIPTAAQTAAVIDGQHRLFSFAKVDGEERASMNLVCAIFLDLPRPLQAQIFATINSTQKRVDRSLTYELFGYNVGDEEEIFWPPDKLAVFLTRRLSTDKDSCLRGRIAVAPKLDEGLRQLSVDRGWGVSTAVVVDGILRLISSNPKRDSNSMKKSKALPRGTLVPDHRDRSPLRRVYIEGNDALLYKIVLNYLTACEEIFWKNAAQRSFITRTVGVQALFDILRMLAPVAYEQKKIGAGYFYDKLHRAGEVDFSEEVFQRPAGSGRTLIRTTIEQHISE